MIQLIICRPSNNDEMIQILSVECRVFDCTYCSHDVGMLSRVDIGVV